MSISLPPLSKDPMAPMLAAIILGSVGILAFYFTPLIVGAVADEFSLDKAQQGVLASCELTGVSFASVSAIFFLKRYPMRFLATVGLVLLILSNIASCMVDSYIGLLVSRFAAGVGGGVLLSYAAASLAQTANPTRSFGLLIAAEYFFAALGFSILPALVEEYGIKGIFMSLSILGLCSVPLLLFVAKSKVFVVKKSKPASMPKSDFLMSAIITVVAIAVFQIGLSSVWAYLERMAAGSGIDAHSIGFSLAAASMCSIAGALLVAGTGSKSSRSSWLMFSAIAQVLALLLFLGDLSTTRFLVSVCVLSFFWNITFPYLYGIAAEADKTGRNIVAANAAAFIGTAIGPALAGFLLGDNDYNAVVYIGMASMLFCWFLSFLSVAKVESLRKTGCLKIWLLRDIYGGKHRFIG